MQRNFIAFKVRSKCSGFLFDVSSIWRSLPKTVALKQKFAYPSPVWRKLLLHRKLYWSQKNLERLGFCLNHVVALSKQGPDTQFCLYEEGESKPEIRRASKTSQIYQGAVAICECCVQHCSDGQPHRKESIPHSRWLTATRSNVAGTLKSQNPKHKMCDEEPSNKYQEVDNEMANTGKDWGQVLMCVYHH